MSYDESLEERSVASIRATVAAKLRKVGSQEFRSIQRIENYNCNNDVAVLPTVDNVFGAIAGALEEAGIFGDYSTVGGVIKKLITKGRLNNLKWIAHHIGCACQGVATGEKVAEQILTIDEAGRPQYQPARTRPDLFAPDGWLQPLRPMAKHITG
jgi:hypothetical protein